MTKKFFRRIKSLEKADLIVMWGLLLGIFSFLIFTKTLTSGFHFIDDHQMVSIKSSLLNNSFLRVTFDYIKADLLIRFRPIYYLYYISTIKVFGLNFLFTSIFVGFLAFFSFCLFYLGFRKLKHSSLLSLLFIFLMFIGPQFAIWWRLGTNETIGIFFLGLTFLFLSRCLEEKNPYGLNNLCFVIFLTITSLAKESFVIVVPAFIVFKIWNEKRQFKITVKESIKNNRLLIVPIFAILIELIIIKFFVGTNQIGYAGIPSSTNEFVNGLRNILFNQGSLFGWIVLLGILALFLFLSLLFPGKDKWKEFNNTAHNLLIYLTFVLAIVLPQLIMHAKSGMVERYLLPTTFGLALLAMVLIENMKQKIFKFFAITAVIVFIVISLSIMTKSAVSFAESGKDANFLLSTVLNNSNSESKILLVADPVHRFEVSYSIKTYLSYYDRSYFYAYPMVGKYDTDFENNLEDQWKKWFEGKELENINGSPDIIIVFDKVQSEIFFSQSNLLATDYENVLSGPAEHAVYKKR